MQSFISLVTRRKFECCDENPAIPARTLAGKGDCLSDEAPDEAPAPAPDSGEEEIEEAREIGDIKNIEELDAAPRGSEPDYRLSPQFL